MKPGCLLLDLEGFELTAQERELLRHPLVAGVILFSRNYHDKQQLHALCQSIYQVRSPCIICVDQEGGRVQRFIDGFVRLPAMREIALPYRADPEGVKLRLSQVIRTQLTELLEAGVNVNLAPVLDLDDGVSKVIGERSLGPNADQVVDLASTVLSIHSELNMPAVAKHFPGHGGVSLDSHHELPVDGRSLKALTEADLAVFVRLLPFLDAVMTAHIVYTEVDDNTPTFSKRWLKELLREQYQFSGIVFSDDLSMKGAAHLGGPDERCRRALEAGCDLLLLCNDRQATFEALDHVKYDSESHSHQRIVRWCQQLRGPWHG